MKALLLVILLFTSTVHAELYMTGGVGKADLRHYEQNGYWYQEGYDYKFDEKANAWKIGVGWQINRRWAVEADYRDLGEYNGIARFVSDENYNVDAKTCRDPCEPTLTGWQNGTANGIGLSAIYALPGKITPFIRGGMFVHNVKFSSYTTLVETPLDRRLYEVRDENFERISARPFAGIGVRYKDFDIEYTFYPDVGTVLTAYRNVSTVMVSVRF